MSPPLIVTGTDTGIGKTVFSAGLVGFLGASYWKPIQSGLEEETDSAAVARLAQLPPGRVLPEAARLQLPASPHLSAEREGMTLDPDSLMLPEGPRPLVVEGAGGLLVPLTRKTLFIDVFARWGAPVILCARAGLGTLNHTLLSLEALRARRMPILGVALLGDAHADNARVIAEMGQVPVLGRLPRLDPLTPESLATAFASAFRRADFDPERACP